MNTWIKSLLPDSLIEGIRSLRSAGYAVSSYSQEGEDVLLSRLFGAKKSGFYVDVGAHHPQRFSNTYAFYKRGWRGINIDARPGSMVHFRRSRPRDINIEAAISSKEEVLCYYAFDEPAINTFSTSLAQERELKTDYRIIDRIEIRTVALNTILQKYLPVGQSIDFLSVDVEGLDCEVLGSLDLSLFRPKCILIEALNTDIAGLMDLPMTAMLKTYDYRPFAKTYNTVFYLDEEFFQDCMR